MPKQKRHAWGKIDKELQKWNYNEYRRLGYPPDKARKWRNRSPETTVNFVLDDNRNRRSLYLKPHPAPIIPEILYPRVNKSLEKTKREFKTLFDVSPGLARKYENMKPEKYILLKRRMAGFFETCVELTGKTRKQILDEINKGVGKAFSLKKFFGALRKWYEKKVGVRPDSTGLKLKPEKGKGNVQSKRMAKP